MKIIYQDADIVVVDKPAGVASHAAQSFRGSDVVDLLFQMGVKISTSGDSYRQGVVSRLDVGTSGVMVLAKNEDAYQNLKQQFSDHSVRKIYHALAHGMFSVKHGTISAPIGRHPKNRALFAVVDDGKPATTHFDALEDFNACTLLEIQLETGRTHQIRVHLSAYGHALIGDMMYGKRSKLEDFIDLQRPFLHSLELTINHPISNKVLTFTSPYPTDLTDALEKIRE